MHVPLRGCSSTVLSPDQFFEFLVFSPTLLPLLFLVRDHIITIIIIIGVVTFIGYYITVIIISTGLLAVCDGRSGWG